MSLTSDFEQPAAKGILAALSAFLIWGFLPLYWKSLESISSLEILCHRMVWSFVVLTPVLLLGGRLGGMCMLPRTAKTLFGLFCSSALLGFNWFLFIWAVNSGMVLETSLGYYINPLINILLGVLVFRERLSTLTGLAIVLAALGVLYQVIAIGHVPWVSLGLGCSFAAYGLLRKVLLVEALPGLFTETLIFLPFALGWLLWQGWHGNSFVFRGDFTLDLLVMASGILTSMPLFLFAFGVRRIPMTTLGVLQYVSPSITFLLGVFVFHEPFSMNRLITFLCIWAGLAVYTWDSMRQRRLARESLR